MSDLVSISTLAEINPVNDRPKNIDLDVSFIPMADVTESAVWVNKQIRKAGEVYSGFTSFRDGDVLFAKITPCMENGKGALAKDLKNGIGYGSTEFHVIRAKKDVSPEFLNQILKYQVTRERALAYFTGSAGQQRVSKDFFDRYLIPNFSFNEQNKIAQILSSIDEQIGLTEKLIEKKGFAKEGLLVNFFSIQPEELLRNIANVIMGQSPSSTIVSDNLDDGLPFLQGCAEFTRLYPSPSKSCFGECKKAPQKSILISVRAPVGDTNIADQEYAIGRGLASIFPREGIEADYLAFAIEFSKPKLRKVAQGSTFEAVGSQDILNLKVNFHSEPDKRNRVSKILNAIDGEIESNIRLLEKLQFQKQGLMQDLLTGQVRFG